MRKKGQKPRVFEGQSPSDLGFYGVFGECAVKNPGKMQVGRDKSAKNLGFWAVFGLLCPNTRFFYPNQGFFLKNVENARFFVIFFNLTTKNIA